MSNTTFSAEVVIPWRGFRCFTPFLIQPSVWCGDVAKSCNPLAGIQVFHTWKQLRESLLALLEKVVIPWRGFRCFTLLPAAVTNFFTSGCNPLAGIQVFHTYVYSTSSARARSTCCNPLAGIQVFHTTPVLELGNERRVGVVIPWRGFRCFTLKMYFSVLSVFLR